MTKFPYHHHQDHRLPFTVKRDNTISFCKNENVKKNDLQKSYLPAITFGKGVDPSFDRGKIMVPNL
jgi:hypothetical protein